MLGILKLPLLAQMHTLSPTGILVRVSVLSKYLSCLNYQCRKSKGFVQVCFIMAESCPSELLHGHCKESHLVKISSSDCYPCGDHWLMARDTGKERKTGQVTLYILFASLLGISPQWGPEQMKDSENSVTSSQRWEGLNRPQRGMLLTGPETDKGDSTTRKMSNWICKAYCFTMFGLGFTIRLNLQKRKSLG